MLLIAGNLVYDSIAGPVEHLAWDQTTWPARFASGLGGNGASTAFAAALSGAPVRLVTACADDAHGQICRQQLTAAGVDAVFLPNLSGPTAVTFGLFHPSGARALFHRPGILEHAFAEVPSLLPYGENVTWLHIANPFAIPALRRLAPAYLAQARRAGWTTSIDLGWDRLGQWRDVIGPCLPHLDWLFANAAEAAALGPVSVPSVIKLGAAGCSVNGVTVPAPAVEAVDSTGAGDCFCGAFLAASLRGLPPLEAARLANIAGAQSVSSPGATTGLISSKSTSGTAYPAASE